MPNLYTETTINAPRFAVWDALIRKEEWHRWNTFLYDCDPNLPIRLGGELFLALRRVEGEDETEFQPRVILMQDNRCLRWIAKVPGFRSEHIFQLGYWPQPYQVHPPGANFGAPLADIFTLYSQR